MKKLFFNRSVVLLLSGVAGVSSTAALAQQAEVRATARVINLGADEGGTGTVTLVADGDGDEKSLKVKIESPKFWLGISLKPIDGDLAKYLGSTDGVFVESVFPESPAAKGGIKQGDILITANGTKLTDPKSLFAVMNALKAGENGSVMPVAFEFLRNGAKQTVEVAPADRPKEMQVQVGGGDEKQTITIDADAEAEEVLSNLRSITEGKDGVRIFRFGSPAKLLIGPESKAGSEHSKSESKNVHINKDGHVVEVRVHREGDGDAKIVVVKDGDKKEFTEKDLEKIPEDIREQVKSMLSTKPNAASGTLRMEVIGGDLNESGIKLNLAELIGKNKALAEEVAARAQASAKIAREAAKMPSEVNELKAQIESLRAEVKALRDQLDKK